MSVDFNELLKNAETDEQRFYDLAANAMVKAANAPVWPIRNKFVSLAAKYMAQAKETAQAAEKIRQALRDDPKEVRRSLLRVMRGMLTEWCIDDLIDRLPQYEYQSIEQQLRELSELGTLKQGTGGRYVVQKL